MGSTKVSEEKFKELEPYAANFLDQITMDHYQLNDLSDDSDAYRVRKFKKAMALEVEYLSTAGATSLSEALMSSPTSVSVGPMRLETQNSGSATVGRTMVSLEAYRALTRTGLLYRGLREL